MRTTQVLRKNVRTQALCLQDLFPQTITTTLNICGSCGLSIFNMIRKRSQPIIAPHTDDNKACCHITVPQKHPYKDQHKYRCVQGKPLSFSQVPPLRSHNYHTHNTSNTECGRHCRCNKKFSVTLAGCPKIQFSADTIYLETTSDLTVQGFPQGAPHNFRANHKSRLSPMLLTHWLHLRGSHNPSLGLINFLEQFTELRNSLFTSLLKKDIIKETNDHPDARDV